MANISYTHEYSKYPEEVLTLTNYKDVDDTIANVFRTIDAGVGLDFYADVPSLVIHFLYNM